jgi:hypothetical protein
MKKLFAYAACLLAGALIFLPHSDAKPMGPGPKGKPWAFKHHHGLHAHHLAHHFHHHHHRFARDFAFFPDYFDYGTPYIEPTVVEVPRDDDVTGSAEPRKVSVWRAPHGGCTAEEVTVPATAGGETTVRVIRC